MPIYEYQCKQCDCAFETLVWSSKEDAEVRCPRCQSAETERILSCFSAGSSLGKALGNGCSTRSSGFS